MTAATLFDIIDGGASASPFVVVTLPGPPVAKGRPRFRAGMSRSGKPFAHVYTPAKTSSYEDGLKMMARAAMRGRAPLTGPIAVRLFAMIPIPASWSQRKRAAALHPTSRPDLDNYFKAAFDAMNGVVYEDDAQICRALTVKEYGEKPGLIVEVFQL